MSTPTETARPCPKCGQTKEFGDEYRLCETCDPSGASLDALATLQAENAELRAKLGYPPGTTPTGNPLPPAMAKVYDELQDDLGLPVRLERAESRATAAEGERDRLREALIRIAGVLTPGFCNLESLTRNRCGDTPVCSPCIARKALAATPHTEGEAKP